MTKRSVRERVRMGGPVYSLEEDEAMALDVRDALESEFGPMQDEDYALDVSADWPPPSESAVQWQQRRDREKEYLTQTREEFNRTWEHYEKERLEKEKQKAEKQARDAVALKKISLVDTRAKVTAKKFQALMNDALARMRKDTP